MEKRNIFVHNIIESKEEVFEKIISDKNFFVERIISSGQRSAEGFWYNQEQSEWVIVLQGNAKIEFEDDVILELNVGDYVLIPPHKKHRVIETSQTEKTIWLAIHYFTDK